MALSELLGRIDEYLERSGLSDRRASIQAGASADFIRDLRRKGKRVPPADILIRLAKVIGAAPEYLLEAVDGPLEAGIGSPQSRATVPDQYESNVRMAPADLRLPAPASMPRDVPVYGTAECGPEGVFETRIATDLHVDWVRRPPGLAGAKGAFAIYAVGDSMAPWRQPGETIFVHPDKPPRSGQHVMIVLRNGLIEEDGQRAMIKKLVGQKGGNWVFEQYNPPKELTFPEDEVTHVWRVIEWEEALGFA